MWHAPRGLGQIMIHRLYLSHFLAVGGGIWVFKIGLSESSIFLFKNFSGKFLYDFIKSHFPYVNSSCKLIVIDWWSGQSSQNYSLVINKIYNSNRKHTLLFSLSLYFLFCKRTTSQYIYQKINKLRVPISIIIRWIKDVRDIHLVKVQKTNVWCLRCYLSWL